MRRHHVVRQAGLEVVSHLVTQGLVILRRGARHQVGRQHLAQWASDVQHHRLADGRMLQQTGFDFAQLDAIATNLHLMIDPADVLQHAVLASPRQVTGAVQTLARRTERMRHEHRHGAPRISDITATDAGPCHAQLTDGTQRHEVQRIVEQVQAIVVGRRSDRQISAASGLRIDPEKRHIVGALGRTIGIHQADLRVTLQPLAGQFRRHGFTGRQHPAQAVERCLGFGEQAGDQRRHAFQHADALRLNMRQQRLRITGDVVRHDIHPSAKQRRGKELPDRNVETLRGGLGDHIAVAQAQVRHFAQLVIEHAALLDHHTLRQPGGA